MPIVSFTQRKHKPTPDYSLGSLLMSLSFYVLLINIWAGILIVSILLSLLAKCYLPFLQFFCVKQGSKGHEGRYMALFTMMSQLAHIASSKTGLTIIDAYGYHELVRYGQFRILSIASCIWLQKTRPKEKTIPIIVFWACPHC
jgi:predicted MFS family arabinose efflux permease